MDAHHTVALLTTQDLELALVDVDVAGSAEIERGAGLAPRRLVL